MKFSPVIAGIPKPPSEKKKKKMLLQNPSQRLINSTLELLSSCKPVKFGFVSHSLLFQ